MQEYYSEGTGAWQVEFEELKDAPPPAGWLSFPCGLTRFQQTEVAAIRFDEMTWTCRGRLEAGELDNVCPHCGATMVGHGTGTITLADVPRTRFPTRIVVERPRFLCPCCGRTTYSEVPFQAPRHRITNALVDFVEHLLELGLTLKEIASICGIHRHVVKAIDKRRLMERHTDGGKLGRPRQWAPILGIDEFLLHNGRVYATFIMDLGTGEILWIAMGRGKDVVHKFVEHVGLDWMGHVEAVCCDMNAGFANAFVENCPHMEIVYDRFHIVRHFNEDVLDNVRKDEQARLEKEGDHEAATRLKRSKYILYKTRAGLAEMDKEAEEGKVVRRGSELFGIPGTYRKGGKLARYEAIIGDNALLLTADLVKEALGEAYRETDRDTMRSDILDIIEQCRSTGNKHFCGFANLLENHVDGIVSHAEYPYSSGKVEGTVNKIKAIRRRGYGYADDTYFFLKIIDASCNRVT